ncbi:hypothetical protein GGR54DRAFT_399541 [Hypoxylon sp. NC1633]|nr:hypothetical protein GGR54DRAFT_399541 [Hypoxylon sp. NC1633]
MATRLPSALPRRPTSTCLLSSLPSSTTSSTRNHLKPSHTPLSHTPSRAATIIRRPRRPYTFTQMVRATDGSTYTLRTTSPVALYKCNKDTRNHVLWQPSDKTLRNIEVDEAGKLAAFRSRFGRGWDAEKSAEALELEKLEAAAVAEAAAEAAAAAAGAGVKGEGADAAKDVGKEKSQEKKGRTETPPAAAAASPEDALSDLIASYSAKQEPLKGPTSRSTPKKNK